MMKSFLKKIIPRFILTALWHRPKAIFASLLYGFPARKLICVAVAGTKGKTSTAYYLSQLLDAANMNNALFTTAAIKIDRQETLNTLKLTTATPFFLQRFLRTAASKKCTHAILEVSSHAIVQQRIWGIAFDTVIITNLTPDHAEYHPSVEDYISVHTHLIGPQTHTVIIDDSDISSKHFHPLFASVKAVSVSSATFIEQNKAMAASAARALGIHALTIEQALPLLRNAPGRMEYINEGQPYTVIVDYAHSPVSLEAFFAALGKQDGRIIALFGACGERDARQRPAMGRILEEHADRIIITNDDPYTEDPKSIAKGVLRGFREKNLDRVSVKLDRSMAIHAALSYAQNGDTVCILGKGSETQQVIGSQKIPWDDREVTRMLIRELQQAHKSQQRLPSEAPRMPA